VLGLTWRPAFLVNAGRAQITRFGGDADGRSGGMLAAHIGGSGASVKLDSGHLW
jgi:hypothetical protein